MKRHIITALLLLGLLSSATTLAENISVVTRGDTTLIVSGSDTVTVAGSEWLKKSLPALLNDTLVDFSATKASNEDNLGIAHQNDIEEARIWSRTTRSIIDSIATAAVFIVFFCLLFYFLHRRRKYRMVERAIDNNYPLPPYLFGQTTYNIPPIPTPAENNPTPDGETPVDPVVTGEPITPPPFNPSTAPMRVNWRAFSKSFTIIAVGIGMMIFFYETPIFGICTIVVLIGIGRAFIDYQDQRDAIDAWRKR